MDDNEKKEDERKDRKRDGLLDAVPSWAWLVLGSLAFIFFVLPFLGRQSLAPQDTEEPESIVSIDRVAENPDQFLGQTVTVSSEIGETIGNRAFTLNNPGLLDDNLLVLGPEPFEAVGGGPGELLFNSGETVQVTGTVRKFNLTQMEEDLGVDLPDEEYSQFEGKPVVVAERVQEIR